MKLIYQYIFVLVLIWWESINAIHTPNERTTKPPFVKSWRKIALQQHQMNSPVVTYHNYSRVTVHNQNFPQPVPLENAQQTQIRNYSVLVTDTDVTEPGIYSQEHAHQGRTFSGNYDQQHLANRDQHGTRVIEQTYEPDQRQGGGQTYQFASQQNTQHQINKEYQTGSYQENQDQRTVHDKLAPLNQNIQVNDQLGSFSGYTGSQAPHRNAKTYESTGQQQTQYQTQQQFNKQYQTSEHNIQGQRAVHDKLAPVNQNMKVHGKLDSFGRYQQGNTYSSQSKPSYQIDPGHSNLPPLKDELEVFGYHYPPRANEVYPFNKPPKPYSSMAFEVCPKNVTGQLVYLWSCSQFLNCWKGRGFIQNCAPGTKFNPETLECDFPHKVNCISGTHNQKVAFEKLITPESQSETLCKPNFSGLLPYPKDCTKFINCANGQTFVQDCGPGTAFNSKIQACDHPHVTGCNIKRDEEDTTATYPYELTEHDVRTGRGHIGSYQDRRQTSGDHLGYYSQTKTDDHYGQNWGTNQQHGSQQGSSVSTQHTQTGLTSEYSGGNAGHYNQHATGQLPTLREVYHHYGQRVPPSSTGTTQGSTNTYSTIQSSGQNTQYPQNCSPTSCQGSSKQPVGPNTHISSSSHTIVSGRGENVQGYSGSGHQSVPSQQPCTSSTCQGQSQPSATYHNQQGTVQGHYIKNYDQGFSGSNQTGQASTQQQYGYHQTNTGRGVARTSPFNTTSGHSWSSSTSAQNRGYTQSSTHQGQNITQDSTRPGREYKNNESAVKCPAGHSGLLPHPFICEKFLNCVNGGTFIQDCGPGTVFNPDLKVCDWPYNVKCISSGTQKPAPAPAQPYIPGKPDVTQGRGYGHTTIYTQHGYNQTGRGQTGTTQVQYGGGTPQSHTSGQPGWQIGVQRGTYGTGQSGQVQGQGQIPVYRGQPTSQQVPSYSGQTHTVSGQAGRGQYTGTAQTSQGESQTGSNTHFVTNQQGSDHIYTSQTNRGRVPIPAGQICQGDACTTHSGTYSGQGGTHSSQGGTYTSQAGTYTSQGGTDQPGIYTGQGATGQRGIYTGQGGTEQRGIYTGQGGSGQTGTYTGQRGTYTSQRGHDGTYTGQSQIYTDQTREQGKLYPEQTNQGQVPIYTSGTGHEHASTYTGGTSSGHRYPHNTGTGQTQPAVHSQHIHSTVCNHTTTNYGNLPSSSQVYNSHGSQSKQVHHSQGSYSSQFIEPEPGLHTTNVDSLQASASHETKHHSMSDPGKPQNYTPNAHGTNVASQTLTTTVNVHESANRKGSRHWPPPFPSTDTSADYYFEETTSSTVRKDEDRKTWKSVKQCSETEFQCSDSCVPLSWVCNGYNDCSGGMDEKNCTHLQKFTMNPNHRLYKHEIEKWLNTDVETCAGYCLYSKTFPCKSFNFKRDSNVCLLCDTNVGLSGALTASHQYDYYEIASFSVNCTNMYECSNKKCINFTQVCDGHDDCGNRMDEKHCSAESLGYAIKLSGSHFKNEGRIEIKVFDEWGYICDDQFGLRDADVVCKELGFPQGALEVKKGSHFARNIKDNETYYLMDDVSCFGNETSLRDCDFNGWGTHNCMPQEIVGVVCKTPEESCPKDHWKCDTTRECLPLQFVCDGVFDCADHSDEGVQHCEAPIEVRLVNGTSKQEGRVEVRFRGIWGTVCDDDFTDLAAKVICKSLGYHGSAVAKKDAAFGAGEGPIWLDQVSCFGNESHLEACAHWNWGEHNCEHNEDAGVVCSSLDTTEYEKKSKDFDIMHMIPPSPPPADTIFSGKCGHRGDDLFFDENENEKNEPHFRVVQGSVAKKGEYPWQATIRVRGVTKSSHWCGAVILSNKYVLTAAHCLVGFSKGAYIIRAGDYNVDENEGTEVEAYIEDFYIHERFRQDGHMNNDIALIRLKGAGLHLSKQVQPICLPDKNATYRHGMNCTISGFGSTDTGKSSSSHVLRAGWVSIQSQHVCKMPHVYGHSITDGMFCAGSLDEGVDSCDGDSGGPLACLDQGLFTLYGITSWGQRCGHANKPGVYVKISHYREWLDKKIQETS